MNLVKELEDLMDDYLHLGSEDDPFMMGHYHGGQEACREAIKIVKKYLKKMERQQKKYNPNRQGGFQPVRKFGEDYDVSKLKPPKGVGGEDA